MLIVADEECGGHYGAEWLLREQPHLKHTEVLLGEGAYSLNNWSGRKVLHAIATAEKGYLELELTCNGPTHHASMPDGRSAPERLTRALEKVLHRENPIRLTPPTTQLLRCLGRAHGGLSSWIFRQPAVAARLGLLGHGLDPIMNAMLRDTVALTVLDSGRKNNVVPHTARGVLSMRLLPGTDPNALTEHIRRTVDDPEVKIRTTMFKAPTASDLNTFAYQVLERQLSAYRDGMVVPILSPGASDCRFWRAAGVPCYGWVPFTIPTSDLHSVHGVNERLSINSFGAGIEVLHRVVTQLAGDQQESPET